MKIYRIALWSKRGELLSSADCENLNNANFLLQTAKLQPEVNKVEILKFPRPPARHGVATAMLVHRWQREA